MLWCFVRQFVRAPAGRQRFNVLGALNAITHELILVTNDAYINADSVCELLHLIAARGLYIPVTLILDNARYQKCHLVIDLARTLGIELLYLPTYSPNLNIIERLWKFVKESPN
jgi:transposase